MLREDFRSQIRLPALAVPAPLLLVTACKRVQFANITYTSRPDTLITTHNLYYFLYPRLPTTITDGNAQTTQLRQKPFV